MPPELDNMDPEMGATPEMDAEMPADDAGGETIGTHGEVDREGEMAKAQLTKLASYSGKLLDEIQDDDQLEAWVQSKIAIAADNIAAVYHYLAYEMKFAEISESLQRSTLSEGQRRVATARLMEAKAKMAALKKAQAIKMSEDITDQDTGANPYASKAEPEEKEENKTSKKVAPAREREEEDTEPCEHCGGAGHVPKTPTEWHPHVKAKAAAYNKKTRAHHAAMKRLDAEEGIEEGFDAEDKVGSTRKTATGVHTKTATGSIHKNTSYADGGDDDVIQRSGKGTKSHAKAMSASEKKDRAPHQKQSKTGTWGMKDHQKFDNRKEVNEGIEHMADLAHHHACEYAKHHKMGNLEHAMHHKEQVEECGGMMSHGSNGSIFHKHPGLNNGQMYECGAMAPIAEAKKAKPDFLDMDKDGNKKESMKKAIKDKKVSEAAKPSAGLSKAKKSAVVKDAKAGKDIGKPGKSFDKVAKAAGGGKKGEKIAAAAMWKNIKETTAYIEEKKDLPGKQEKLDVDKDGKLEKSDFAALRAGKKAKETVKESSEFTRMQAQLGRLNRNENLQLNEGSEVDQIRALTKRLLG